MIRREEPSRFRLIRQTDHAELAAVLARNWAAKTVPLADEFLFAVAHHDDGWRDWELAPRIDPETGLPRDFLEMPVEVSTGIWAGSIDTCGRHSPWSGLWVSAHFCALAEASLKRHDETLAERRANSAETPVAIDPEEQRYLSVLRGFLTSQRKRQREWLRQLNIEEDDARVKAGFEWVRFFDWFSLLLCMHVELDDRVATAPDETDYHLRTVDGMQVAVTPWPFRSESLTVTVPVRDLDEQTWPSDASFRRDYASVSDSVLTWRLIHTPDGADWENSG